MWINESNKMKIYKSKRVATKPIVSFCISPDGKKLACAISDYSIVVLSAKNLSVNII